MHRLQYRNFGGYETLRESRSRPPPRRRIKRRCFITPCGATCPAALLPFPNRRPSHRTARSRWMGSAAMDNQGNLAAGTPPPPATASSPRSAYAGRLATDPPNGLFQGEATLIAGSGVQTDVSGRWGDYSALTVDPADDSTSWYTTEYYTAAGSRRPIRPGGKRASVPFGSPAVPHRRKGRWP